MMNKSIIALMAALALSGPVCATGAYDGIYQEPGSPVYWSVHQNGSRLIVTLYTNTALTGQTLSFPSGQMYTPPIFDTWSLLSGSITGANASISGMVNFRACTISVNLSFTNTNAAISLTAVTPTSDATSQGFSCPSLYPNLPIASSMTKIF